MNIFTNEQYLKDQLRRARRLQLFGVLAIFISFFLSFGFGVNYLLVYLAYPFLFTGLPLWTIGRATTRRLSGTPRVDHVLNNELKWLNNKHSLHHYLVREGRVANHVLVGPSGVIVLQASDAVGPVSCVAGARGDRWKSKSTILDKLTGLRPPVNNPSQDLDRALGVVKEVLTGVGKPNVPVKGLVAFTTNPDLEVEGCSYAAVPLNELKGAVREMMLDMTEEGGEGSAGRSIDLILTSEDRRRLNLALSPQITPAPTKPVSARR